MDVAGADAGAIYVFLGPLSGDYSGTDADVVIDGETAGDFSEATLRLQVTLTMMVQWI